MAARSSTKVARKSHLISPVREVMSLCLSRSQASGPHLGRRCPRCSPGFTWALSLAETLRQVGGRAEGGPGEAARNRAPEPMPQKPAGMSELLLPPSACKDMAPWSYQLSLPFSRCLQPSRHSSGRDTLPTSPCHRGPASGVQQGAALAMLRRKQVSSSEAFSE